MIIEELEIPGCHIIRPKIISDDRGIFVKTFHDGVFKSFGLELNIKEEFYSISKKNVLRGLHFQRPPSAHSKLVYCPKGRVVDYILDIRVGSPTYGKHISVELSESNGYILHLPIGIAHGFLSLTDESLMVYKTDSVYDPVSDDGISFYSSGIELPISGSEVVMSDRDAKFLSLEKYRSEFVYV